MPAITLDVRESDTPTNMTLHVSPPRPSSNGHRAAIAALGGGGGTQHAYRPPPIDASAAALPAATTPDAPTQPSHTPRRRRR